jgi:hypothetical protein
VQILFSGVLHDEMPPWQMCVGGGRVIVSQRKEKQKALPTWRQG